MCCHSTTAQLVSGFRKSVLILWKTPKAYMTRRAPWPATVKFENTADQRLPLAMAKKKEAEYLGTGGKAGFLGGEALAPEQEERETARTAGSGR